MILNRREVLQGTVAATVLAANRSSIAQTASSGDFSIDTAFVEFMRNIGGMPQDGGGSVTFTGRDPIVRSRFRTGASMTIPAMGAGVGASAIWRERTGQSQYLTVDLRQGVYAVAPWARLLVEELREHGMLPGDPLPAEWTWQPTLNDRRLQAPLAIGNPLSFAIFETRDGRRVTPTGFYPQHFVGFLRVVGGAPDTASIAAAIRTFDSDDLKDRVGEAGIIMGIHRTQAEWRTHPQGRVVAGTPLVEIIKVGDSGSSRPAPLSGFSACTPPSTTPFNLQRHLLSRATLRIFRAEAANQWHNAVRAV